MACGQVLTAKSEGNGTELTIAIATKVTTLGDFPLDPEAGLGWIWSEDGRRLLWASPKAREIFGLDADDQAFDIGHQDTLRGMIADLALDAPDQEPVRVQQLALVNPAHREVFMCLARAVPMAAPGRDGRFGILAVAVGAPARSLEDIKAAISRDSAIETGTPKQEVPESVPANDPIRELPLSALQIGQSQDAAIPAWVEQSLDSRRPLRFIWQTDEWGRFVHLSRELSEAVGISNAMLMGQTWLEVAMHTGMRKSSMTETDAIEHGFASRETWTAKAVLWPVVGTDLGIPVEMAGMPVRENNRFAGFRGYGIARIERAVIKPGSAEEALAKDDEPTVETGEEKYGPAVSRALAAQQSALVAAPEKSTDEIKTTVTLQTTRPVLDKATTLRRPLPLSNTPDMENLPTVLALQKFIDESQRPPATKTELDNPAHEISGNGNTSGSDPGKNLTDHERRAFRDIARALGSTSLEPQTPVHDLSSQKPSTVVRRKPLGSLTANTAPPPETARNKRSEDLFDRSAEVALPTPVVVSFEAAQGLRNQKNPVPGNLGDMPTLLEKLPVGLLVMQSGKVVFANPHLLDMLGHADFDAFTAAGGIETLFISNEMSNAAEMRSFAVRDSNGHALTVRATIQSIAWNDTPATLTSFLSVQSTGRDTGRTALELDMLAARAELRELQFVLDTATDGIISLNSEGRILGLNRSAEALFGFDQNEIAGESITTLLAPESHVAALDYLEGLKVNGVASIMNDGRDIVGRERHGGAIPLFMTLGRLGDDSRAQRFCAVLRDVTAWKKVEADLQEAKRTAEDSNANKTDFLARISHEVRTPLNAILGFSQVIMAETFGPVGNARYAQYAKDIHASGQHVLSLVNDLLDLSKINSGKLELAFGSVDITSIVAECVSMIQPQATVGKIIVRSQLSSKLPPVVADDRSLRQILLNLLSNAIKFTEAGGQVIVSATFNDQGEVVIRVRDTGIGMNDDELKSAMEPFRQVPGPRASGGTGLGLPLTKALVEANRASFSLVSERNKGTLAEIVFPSTRVLAE